MEVVERRRFFCCLRVKRRSVDLGNCTAFAVSGVSLGRGDPQRAHKDDACALVRAPCWPEAVCTSGDGDAMRMDGLYREI